MQILVKIFYILFLVFSKSVFSMDYFQYEYAFKKEIKKLSVTEKNDYSYIHLGGESGCYHFQGTRSGKISEFNYKKNLKLLDSMENPNNDRSLLTIVKGQHVRVFRPGKKALDQIILLNRKLMQTKKSQQLIGVSMKSKRLGKKKVKVTFKKHGEKPQEIIIPQDINSIFSIEGITFDRTNKDEKIFLRGDKKTESITLNTKDELPKKGVIRYQDHNISHHKKGPKKYNSLSLCNEF